MAKAPLIWLPLNGDLTNNGIRKTTITNSGTNNNFNYYGPTGKCWCSYTGTTAPTSSAVPGFIATGLPLNNFTVEDISYSIWVRFPRTHLQNWLESGTYVIDTTYSTPQTTIIGYGNTSQGGAGIVAYYQTITSGTLNFTGVGVAAYMRASNGGAAATPTVSINLDEWCHLASTYSTKTKLLKLYINGVLVQQTTWNGSGWNVITTDIRLNYANVWAGNGKGVFPPAWLSDARIYNEVLSAQEIYDISKGLACHYTFNYYNATKKNLIPNGYGDDGTIGWSSNTNFIDTNLPTSINPSVKKAFYNNTNNTYIPILSNTTYRIQGIVKLLGTNTVAYPSIRCYDYDKNEIMVYHGYTTHSTYRSVLTQDLNPGDTIIHADLSGWTTPLPVSNYYNHVAIFGYKDSSGYVYPNYTYTRDTPVFGTYSDKSNINYSNNTITLTQAFNGEKRSAGTAIALTSDGSTYAYPWSVPSTDSDWTEKTFDFNSSQWERFGTKAVKYIRFMADTRAYVAGVELYNESSSDSKIADESGMGNHGTRTHGYFTALTNNTKVPYEICYDIARTGDWQYVEIPPNILKAENASISFWLKIKNYNTNYATIFQAGLSNNIAWAAYVFGFLRNGSGTNYCFTIGNGSSSTSNQILSPSLELNTWYHIGLTYNRDLKQAKIYINGENTTTLNITAFTPDLTQIQQIRIGHGNTADSYQSDILLSDFRMYGTCLSATDIKSLYNTTTSIDSNNNLNGLLLKETQQNIMWQSALNLSRQQDAYLRRYTQTYCSVTHSSQGAHIVRTPNIAYDGNSNGTYGGIVFRNSSASGVHIWNSNTDNIWGLQKNHRYLFVCHIKGHSANDLGWISTSNNVGWGSGGLPPVGQVNASYYGPSLSAAGATGIDTDIWLDFTITDEVVKTCTTSYSSFVAGNKYLSYMEIGVGFTYGATGSLGTDIYVSNPRLYDITSNSQNNLFANGTISFTRFNELDNLNNFSINNGKEVLTNSIIER